MDQRCLNLWFSLISFNIERGAEHLYIHALNMNNEWPRFVGLNIEVSFAFQYHLASVSVNEIAVVL